MTLVLPVRFDWVTRRTLAGVLVVLAVALSLLVGARSAQGVSWGAPSHETVSVDSGIDRAAPGPVSVIVQADPARVEQAMAAVRTAGGTVGASLPIVDGFEATIPPSAVDALGTSSVVRAVTLNRVGQFESWAYDGSKKASSFVDATQASFGWAAGATGEGIGVAVIDTGISPMNDLSGRIVYGPDLSGEGRLIDSYGHGTVMGGIIAGDGADSQDQPESKAGRGGDSQNQGEPHTGVAPRATLISVKVAGRNGSVDVSTMLQAMHWVSAYRAQFNIRVLNLAWGAPSTQNPAVDPVNFAVERLWRQGIVVVVAAGNGGPDAASITKPGDDPLVLTVGAYDDRGSANTSDDTLPDWSSRGPTAAGYAKPDVVAPGRTLVATRSFGSVVEAENPSALVAPSYIKGSGTSEAAAVASGVVALLLHKRPDLTPDQVKAVLMKTADPLKKVSKAAQGSGRVQLARALFLPAGPAQWQTFASTGLGSIEASRGGRHVWTDCGQDGVTETIVGEIDVRCEPWDGSSWTGSSWTGSSWTGSSWTGSSWTGSSWTGSSWTGGVWTGSSWTGSSWTGSSWTGSSWTGSSWTGSSWTGSSWTGSSWTQKSFQTAFWGDRPKAGARVAGETAEERPR